MRRLKSGFVGTRFIALRRALLCTHLNLWEYSVQNTPQHMEAFLYQPLIKSGCIVCCQDVISSINSWRTFPPASASVCCILKKWPINTYAENEGPDQPAHPRSLIRAFAVRLQNHGYCRKCQGKGKDLISANMCKLTWISVVQLWRNGFFSSTCLYFVKAY